MIERIELVKSGAGRQGVAPVVLERSEDGLPLLELVKAMPAMDMPDNLGDKAIQHFGVTAHMGETGYVMPGGEMLNFRGRSKPGGRGLDHGDVKQIMPGSRYRHKDTVLHNFMRQTGAMRVHHIPATGYTMAEARGPLTPHQIDWLRAAAQAGGPFNADVFGADGSHIDGISEQSMHAMNIGQFARAANSVAKSHADQLELLKARGRKPSGPAPRSLFPELGAKYDANPHRPDPGWNEAAATRIPKGGQQGNYKAGQFASAEASQYGRNKHNTAFDFDAPAPEPVTLQADGAPTHAPSEDEQKLLDVMGDKPMHGIDEIAPKAGMGPAKASASLMLLEMKGHVRRLPGGMFERIEPTASPDAPPAHAPTEQEREHYNTDVRPNDGSEGDLRRSLVNMPHLELMPALSKGYKLRGHTTFQGLDISIEQRKGDIRRGVGEDGKPWRTKMLWPYGGIRGTSWKAVDSDLLDCFIGPNPNATTVFVIHQNDPKTGKYDEDKCMLGFDTWEQARDAYLAHYDDQRFLPDKDEEAFTPWSIEDFKRACKNGKGGPREAERGPLVKAALADMPGVELVKASRPGVGCYHTFAGPERDGCHDIPEVDPQTFWAHGGHDIQVWGGDYKVEGTRKAAEYAANALGVHPHAVETLEKAFPNPFPGRTSAGERLSRPETVRAVRLALTQEQEAIATYQAQAEAASDPQARKLLEDLADEERVHVGELQALLDRLTGDEDHLNAQGYREAEETLGKAIPASPGAGDAARKRFGTVPVDQHVWGAWMLPSGDILRHDPDTGNHGTFSEAIPGLKRHHDYQQHLSNIAHGLGDGQHPAVRLQTGSAQLGAEVHGPLSEQQHRGLMSIAHEIDSREHNGASMPAAMVDVMHPDTGKLLQSHDTGMVWTLPKVAAAVRNAHEAHETLASGGDLFNSIANLPYLELAKARRARPQAGGTLPFDFSAPAPPAPRNRPPSPPSSPGSGSGFSGRFDFGSPVPPPRPTASRPAATPPGATSGAMRPSGGLGGLFDEQQHPRAQEGAQGQYRGGEFVPKGITEGGAPPQEASDDRTQAPAPQAPPQADQQPPAQPPAPVQREPGTPPPAEERGPAGGGAAAGAGAVAGGPDGSSVGRGSAGTRIVTAREHLTPQRDVSGLPEDLAGHLMPHQQQGVVAAVEALDDCGGFILADGTGAGKTRQILATAEIYRRSGRPVLIVTKAEAIKPDWDKLGIVGSMADDSAAMNIPLRLTPGGPVAPGEIAVTTYERLADVVDHVDRNYTVLFDESHALKNAQAGSKKSARGQIGMEIVKQAGETLFASATPIDDVMQLTYMQHILGVRGPGGMDELLSKLGMEQYVRDGQVNWRIRKDVGEQEVVENLGEVFDDLTAKGRMVKREISMDGVQVEFLGLKLPEETHKLMDDIWFFIGNEDDPKGLRKAQALQHMRRQQEVLKVKTAVDWAKREMAEGRSVVLFCHRVNQSDVSRIDRDIIPKAGGGYEIVKRRVAMTDGDDNVVGSEGTAKLLREALQAEGIGDVAEIHGGVTPKKRRENMEKFQANGARVIIATVESGGTGINLDDVTGEAPRSMMILTAPFSAMDNVQACGRIWRAKTKSDARIAYLFGDTDVDRWNRDIIGSKMSQLGATVKGEIGRLDIEDPDRYDLTEEVLRPRTQRERQLPVRLKEVQGGKIAFELSGPARQEAERRWMLGGLTRYRGGWEKHELPTIDEKGNRSSGRTWVLLADDTGENREQFDAWARRLQGYMDHTAQQKEEHAARSKRTGEYKYAEAGGAQVTKVESSGSYARIHFGKAPDAAMVKELRAAGFRADGSGREFYSRDKHLDAVQDMMARMRGQMAKSLPPGLELVKAAA